MTRVVELSRADRERIESRVHPFGGEVPELDFEPHQAGYGIGLTNGHTTRLGVRTEWKRTPHVYPCEKLSLYSWSRDCSLTVDGRTFVPGSGCFWVDPRPNRKGKRWSVTLVAVATEHVERLMILTPALMVRLYNGQLMFALPSEVEL